MSVTIFEALMNADYNLQNTTGLGMFGVNLAKFQVHNAVELLNKGYSLEEEIEPLLEKYGDVENVPDKETL